MCTGSVSNMRWPSVTYNFTVHYTVEARLLESWIATLRLPLICSIVISSYNNIQVCHIQ